MSALTLSERIEAAYDRAVSTRTEMQYALWTRQEKEGDAKAEHSEEWATAKNGDVRAVMLAGWLAEDEEYVEAGRDYASHRLEHRLALLEIERLRLLVEAAKAEGGREPWTGGSR